MNQWSPVFIFPPCRRGFSLHIFLFFLPLSTASPSSPAVRRLPLGLVFLFICFNSMFLLILGVFLLFMLIWAHFSAKMTGSGNSLKRTKVCSYPCLRGSRQKTCGRQVLFNFLSFRDWYQKSNMKNKSSHHRTENTFKVMHFYPFTIRFWWFYCLSKIRAWAIIENSLV